jgi:hypothetical protein
LNFSDVFLFFFLSSQWLLVLACPSEVQAELEQSRASREQDADTLIQVHDARCKSEAISEKAIGDIAKLGRAMSLAMAALGESLGPRMPETLIEEVGRLPGVVR